MQTPSNTVFLKTDRIRKVNPTKNIAVEGHVKLLEKTMS